MAASAKTPDVVKEPHFEDSALAGEDTLQGADVATFLQEQDATVLARLCQHPPSCLAIFTMLPPLSKHLVMRMLYINKPLPGPLVAAWFRDSARESLKASIAVLNKMHLWHSEGDMVTLDAAFRQNLRTAIMGGGTPWVSNPPKADKHTPTAQALDEHQTSRWEAVLNFLVGTARLESEDVRNCLYHAGLKTIDAATGAEILTPLGFQFLLQDRRTQLWFYMLHFLRNGVYVDSLTKEVAKLDLVEAMEFVFKMSFGQLGECYPSEGLTPTQAAVLRHACEVGLAYRRKRKSTRYYPTQSALVLSKEQLETKTEDKRFLVVETNFRVYAYGHSDLKVELLDLFTERVYRLPNLAVANITRESVRAAFLRGITARQILRFLQVHSHVQMKEHAAASFPPLPQTVSDQIILWERERTRLGQQPGVLIRNFGSAVEFETLRTFADGAGILLWHNELSRTLIITEAGLPQVKRFRKKQAPS
eukprot:m.12257 g.12257  ORF g.12257 m.12257 type:complete len:477 (+) comp4211_c0_seq2:239-1669(+)